MARVSRSRTPWIAALTLGALAVSYGCDQGRTTPSTTDAGPALARSDHRVETRDDRGRAVSVPAEPARIVSLLPSHTQTLFTLGLGARVVGVDDFSDDPPEAARLPRLGGLYDTHVEEVLALKPDLVLLSESSNAATPLEQNGVSVWAGSARTFDDVFRVIDAIGTMVGRYQEARGLSDRIHDEIAATERRLSATNRVRVYYELDSTPYTVGPSSFIGVMLAKAGGSNVIPEGLGDFPKISPEVVVSGNPSIILGASLEEIAARPGWDKIEAVRTARVHRLPEAESRLIARPGPRIAEAVRALARWMHPEVNP
jgi:iron complex transport system substrate-binding protein